MNTDSPKLPGLEEFRAPTVCISTERDIYMGIVSPSRFNPRFDDEPDGLPLNSARHAISQETGVFWGCPDGEFRIVVSPSRDRHYDVRTRREFSAPLASDGTLCFTRSCNVGMTGSVAGYEHPLNPGDDPWEDSVVSVEPGRYILTIAQLYRWRSSQFANANPDRVHYHVSYRLAKPDEGKPLEEIPWLAKLHK